MKRPHTSTMVKAGIGVVGYGVWAFMAYIDPAQRTDFLHFNILMAGGTIGLVVRDMHQPPPPTQPPKE